MIAAKCLSYDRTVTNNENKTKPNDADVQTFLDGIEDAQKRADANTLLELFSEVTGEPAKMWGSSIVGFGEYHYKGRSSEGDWLATGFSPRKANLTVYIMDGYDDYQDLLGRIGKATTAKSCLYIKRLADIDMDVLRELVQRSYTRVTSPDFGDYA